MSTIIERFIGLFKGISFNTYENYTPPKLISKDSLDSSYKELKKMLMKAKRDLSKAKKSHKLGKISSDELFDWQYRVHEIEEDIKRLNDNIEEDIDI
tara:strand:- start:8 stop:298 length:291 start_codon:yes stop_codon:yes gene_type:complete